MIERLGYWETFNAEEKCNPCSKLLFLRLCWNSTMKMIRNNGPVPEVHFYVFSRLHFLE